MYHQPHTAKALLAITRIITGLAMLREAVSYVPILGISLHDQLDGNPPDTYHVTHDLFELIPGRVKIIPRQDFKYPNHAEKRFMGANFIHLLEATEVQTETRLIRKAA